MPPTVTPDAHVTLTPETGAAPTVPVPALTVHDWLAGCVWTVTA